MSKEEGTTRPEGKDKKQVKSEINDRRGREKGEYYRQLGTVWYRVLKYRDKKFTPDGELRDSQVEGQAHVS